MRVKQTVRRELFTVAVTFLTILLLFSFVITCSFLLFFRGAQLSAEQVRSAAIWTFCNILFLAAVFTMLDFLRRKLTIRRPVARIQKSLAQVVDGDFTARISRQPTDRWYGFDKIIDSINRMTGELAGIETLRTDFIANVSHELKTPLAVIQNYGTMLRQPGLSEGDRLAYAGAVADGARRLNDLITNILKLNKLESQQIFPQKERFDLGEQLCACLLDFERAWEEKGLVIETDLQEDVIVESDPALLTLVWNNLFSNAVKFTGPGGTVALTLQADGDRAVVTVADTGCGMAPAVGEHIFEKFYQGDASHATEGNGLGLALVKRVVDIVGGDIAVVSREGQGSTFTVTLERASHGPA